MCVSGLGVVNIVAVVVVVVGLLLRYCLRFCDEGKLVFILSGLVFCFWLEARSFGTGVRVL